MKFGIQTVWNWDNLNEMLEKYPVLKNYEIEPVKIRKTRYIKIWDENGRPIRQRDDYRVTRIMISVNSLEQLLELINAVDQPIIISKLEEEHADFNIEIYDGYRE